VKQEQVVARLGEIAEVALGFGPTVAIEAPDTVWVDITGAAHLAGGEQALAVELAARVRALGHVAHVAVSSGPRLAQAFARWGSVDREGCLVVPDAETTSRVRALPVRALPIDQERTSWLVRLGVLTLGDLASLPRAATASRLGEEAGRVLDLSEGKDDSPLAAYVPPSLPEEVVTWDEPASGSEPLLFVLRGLVARLGARLEGRGEAVQALDLTVLHDRSAARLEGVEPETVLRFELAAPLWRSEELNRVIAARLTRKELPAPAVGLRLEARAVTRALALQLSLSRYASGLGGNPTKGPETLPIVLAELGADLGKDKVGLLRIEGSHRPEKKGRLVPVTPSVLVSRPASSAEPESTALPKVPTRLLPRPIPFDAPLRPGATVSVERRLYTVGKVAFEQRIAGVEWWTGNPVSRDYVRAWLEGGSSGLEVVVYVDRASGERKIQAICD
jgi:protein ImuB